MDEMMTTGKGELLAFAGYSEFESAADRTAVKIKEGYMEMGYILKMARDTDILKESGYRNHEEFAEQRYGLDKGTVSRYIRIVERFSLGGNSHELKDSYRNMGFAKLSIMLHMPDAIAEELMDSLSKAEVQEIREELEEEQKVSDIELMIEQTEQKQSVPPLEGDMLTRAMWQLGKEQKELYKKLWQALAEGDRMRLPGILAPQGDAVHMARIPGVGRLMVSISGENVTVTAVRSQEKERHTMQDAMAAVEAICPQAANAAEAYFLLYDEQLEEEKPEKSEAGGQPEKVAPVQPVKEKRKESKVTKARTEKPAPAAVVEEEKQIPGQMEIVPEEAPEIVYREITEEMEENREEPGTGQGEEPGTGKGEEHGVESGNVAEGIPGGEGEDGAAATAGAVKTDAGEEEESLAGIWGEIAYKVRRVREFSAAWELHSPEPETIPRESLKKAYEDAVSLAAAIEKLLIRAGGRKDE